MRIQVCSTAQKTRIKTDDDVGFRDNAYLLNQIAEYSKCRFLMCMGYVFEKKSVRLACLWGTMMVTLQIRLHNSGP